VTVVVINLRVERPGPKYIFTDGLQIEAKNVNGYLADAPVVWLKRQMRARSSVLPLMTLGSVPKDDGYLVLEPHEEKSLVQSHPQASQFIKRYMGSAEFINDKERYCIWIRPEDAELAQQIPELDQRMRRVAEFRAASTSSNTNALSDRPYRFWHVAYKPTDSVIVPSISSGRREYIPIGYLSPDVVISSKGFAVYDAEPWVFALLTSAMHMAWTRAVGGRMREDYQYSNTIVYNNFAVPPLTAVVKEQLTVAALRVLDVREYHCERTLAELYDPDLMPADLRAAHAEVDLLVDSIYSKRTYETDEQRLSDLFAMYEAMAADEGAAEQKRTNK
jgi:hypothetical protein